MSSEYKICIYFRGKEKPVILTDYSTKDSPYSDTLDFFTDVLKGENKVSVMDFANDNLVFNHRDVESVKISKPELPEESLVAVDEDDEVISDEDNDTPSEEEVTKEDEEEVFGEETDIEVVE
jgi:hypothetical protein